MQSLLRQMAGLYSKICMQEVWKGRQKLHCLEIPGDAAGWGMALRTLTNPGWAQWSALQPSEPLASLLPLLLWP